jgi:hypothetical protein
MAFIRIGRIQFGSPHYAHSLSSFFAWFHSVGTAGTEVGLGIPSMDFRDNYMFLSCVVFNFQKRTLSLVKEACSPESSFEEGQSKQPNHRLPSCTASSNIFTSCRFVVVWSSCVATQVNTRQDEEMERWRQVKRDGYVTSELLRQYCYSAIYSQ